MSELTRRSVLRGLQWALLLLGFAPAAAKASRPPCRARFCRHFRADGRAARSGTCALELGCDE